MKGWNKEFSKFWLNLSLLVFAVFVFGIVTNPAWRVPYAFVGIVLFGVCLALSRYFWRRGGGE